MKIDFRIVGTIVGLLAIIILFSEQGSGLGFDSDFTNDFISLLPGIAVIIVGASMVALTISPLFILSGFSAMGVGMAVLIDEMNTASIMIPEIITDDFTLNHLKIVSILVFVLAGAIATSLAGD